jgi:hypothetical protein
MNVVKVDINAEVPMIIDALKSALYEVLIAYDPIDEAIKFKIDNGSWTPPFKAEY